MNDTTTDAFLGGKIMLEQPSKGYRAGVDPVLLASAIPAQTGQSVLDIGCGVGAALLCLAARVPNLTLSGIEVQSDYADLCRKNAAANGYEADIYTTDLRDIPADLKERSFDQIFANPPYFQKNAGKASTRDDRDIALRGATQTADWLDLAYRRLKPKGWLTLIQKADRLPEILRALDARFGSITVTPIVGRKGRNADRFILRTRKHGMTPFVLTAPVALHVGNAHIKDGDDYVPDISRVLRSGAKFPFPD